MQEIAEQPEKNAFEALKKPRNRKNEKHKPLKTVTNTRSTPAVTKTKQPKIYDESNGRKSLAGSKKIEIRYLAINLLPQILDLKETETHYGKSLIMAHS